MHIVHTTEFSDLGSYFMALVDLFFLFGAFLCLLLCFLHTLAEPQSLQFFLFLYIFLGDLGHILPAVGTVEWWWSRALLEKIVHGRPK